VPERGSNSFIKRADVRHIQQRRNPVAQVAWRTVKVIHPKAEFAFSRASTVLYWSTAVLDALFGPFLLAAATSTLVYSEDWELRSAMLLLPWTDVTSAEYLPGVFAYRLRFRNQPEPFVFFAERGYRRDEPMVRRLDLAERYLLSGLGERLRSRWLLW